MFRIHDDYAIRRGYSNSSSRRRFEFLRDHRRNVLDRQLLKLRDLLRCNF